MATAFPHRAIKYLGTPTLFDHKDILAKACARLREVGNSLGDTLVADLHADMGKTIEREDEQINFLSSDAPEPTSRKKAIIAVQAIVRQSDPLHCRGRHTRMTSW